MKGGMPHIYRPRNLLNFWYRTFFLHLLKHNLFLFFFFSFSLSFSPTPHVYHIKFSFMDYRILSKYVRSFRHMDPPKCNFIRSPFYFIIWGFAATLPSKPLHKFDILFRISRISDVLILPAKLIAKRIIRIFAIFAVP